ncbi:MAG: phosphotransferase [Chloroflexi bacterium]|nr:phosphotransferase [Chloroflexota bacterium]
MPTAEQLKRRPGREAMERLLSEIAPGGRITSITRLRGGISCGMHGVNITEKSGAKLRIVVRRYNNYWAENDPDIASREFKTLELLAKTNVPAPWPIWFETSGDIFGAPTIVQSRLPGRADLAPADLDAWLDRLADALAALHRAEFDSAATAHLKSHPEQLARDLKREGLIRRCAKHPDGERVLRVLDSSWPAMPRQTLIHTDYWPGNTVWSRGKLTGIVDWEMPALGEPAYDVAYCRQDLAMLFGLDAADRFLTHYEDVSGSRIEQPHFWDLLVATRAMGILSLWLPGYLDLGRTDITKPVMRHRFREFIQRALASA